MRLYFGCDHAGFVLKNELIAHARELGHEVKDCGAFEYNEEDDYPDFITAVAEKIAHDPSAKGVILGGSGQGEAMAANRLKNVRAAVYYGGPKEIITLSREHNDANILSLGARFLTAGEAKEALERWLNAGFSGEARHKRRLAKF